MSFISTKLRHEDDFLDFSTLYTPFSPASIQTSGNPSRLKHIKISLSIPFVSFQSSFPSPKPYHQPYFKVQNQRQTKHLKHMTSPELSTNPNTAFTPHIAFTPHTCLHTPQISKEHIQLREHTSPTWHCSYNYLITHNSRHHLAPVSIQADQTTRHQEGCPDTEQQKQTNTSAQHKRKAVTTASHTPKQHVH